MKLIFFFILFIVSNLFSQSLQEISNQSIVKIAIFTPDKKFIPIGTGFFVQNKSTIISAFHVYIAALQALKNKRGGTIVAIKSSTASDDNFSVTVNATQYHSRFDLVQFMIDSTAIKDFNVSPLKIAKQNPDIGSDAIAVGYFSESKFPLMQRGVVSGFSKHKIAVDVTELIFDKIVNPGQSGSPLLSVKTKEVIGLLVSVISLPKTKKQTGLSRAVTSTSIRKFLKLE